VAGECDIDHHMGGKCDTRGPDRVIGQLAAQQHGVVSRQQLLAVGVSARAIERRIEGGRLHPVFPGAYAVGHRVLSQHGRWMAAVLAAGQGAVLSHRSAAALWGIRPTSRAHVEVTAAHRVRRRPGIHPHCAVLPPDEMTRYQGIPVTTAPRTLLDLAAVLKPNELDRALNEAEIQRLQGPQAMLERYEGRRGTAALRTLLLNARRSHRSPTEAEFLDFVRAHGLPEPDTNVIVEDYECDAVWRDARLIVELDGYASHGTRRAFKRDRARDRRLTARGWRTMRVTSPDLTAELATELLSSLRA
jgi:very-short-patch-repair endonuclease